MSTENSDLLVFNDDKGGADGDNDVDSVTDSVKQQQEDVLPISNEVIDPNNNIYANTRHQKESTHVATTTKYKQSKYEKHKRRAKRIADRFAISQTGKQLYAKTQVDSDDTSFRTVFARFPKRQTREHYKQIKRQYISNKSSIDWEENADQSNF